MIRFIPQPLLRSVAPAASIALVLFALCLTSFAQAQSEAGPSRSTGTITVGAYVYSGPGFLSPVVRKAIRGESVTILGNNPSGTWLQIGDAEWIAALLVKVDADEASAETTPVIIKTPITVTRLTVKQIAPKQLITNPITTIAITGTKIATATAITDGAEITGTLVTTGGKVLTLGALLKKESTALSVGDLISNTAILSRQTISTTVISKYIH